MRKIIFLICIICFGSLLIWYSHGEKLQDIKKLDLNTNAPSLKSSQNVKVDVNFGKIPLYFITNQGQVNQKAKFYAKASRYTLWITKEGLVFDSTTRKENPKHEIRNPKQIQNPKFKFSKQRTKNTFQQINKSTNKPRYARDVSRLMFLEVNKNPEIIPLKQTKLKVNYFKGNDPSKWVGNIPTSQAVLYKNIYKNIDLKVYGIEKQIEYDWIVKPGGNPEDIKFEYKNVKKTHIDKMGNLVIRTKFGELIHKKPVSYQNIGYRQEAIGNGDKKEVKAIFKKISKNIYGFEVDEYDKSKTLIIDPLVLVYSTYLGGWGYDYGFGIAVDSNGYAYVTGYTQSTDFPTLNQYQADQPGEDVFVTRLDTTESGTASLIYSTYLGGGSSDEGYDIAVDSSGHAYVTGFTISTDFPTLNQYMSDPADDTWDAFVTKLDTTQSGTSSLVYSTYLGGDESDKGEGLAVDDSGNVYVTGYTYSTDFPTLNQYMSDPGGGYNDVFVTRLDTTESGTASLIYSTYLGGLNGDEGNGIAVDSNGYVYVTGTTYSKDFPTLNQVQTYQGSYDAFITKLDTIQIGAASLIYSTYLGGGSSDSGYDIAVDSSGNAYVTGETYSTDFPTLNQYMSDPGDGALDAFVTKLDTSQSGIASLVYSTYLGGDESDKGEGLAVDDSGNVYVTGYTYSKDFPCLRQYQVYQGYWDSLTDVFVTRLDTSQSGTASLIYSTYLGGGSDDEGNGIAVDSSGHAYVTGFTISTDFPCVNQYQGDQGGDDVFVTKLILPGIKITSPNGGEVWAPETVQNITWDCVGLTHNLIIVLRQNGTDVALIDKNINPDLGTYSWTVGDCIQGTVSAGTKCRIIVKEKQTTVADKSDGSFTILPSLTITSPNGGENWQVGTTQNITWDATLPPGDLVKIVLLKTNGKAILEIANNLDPTTGSFAWDIPSELPARDYLIKIKVKDKDISDISDGTFSLY